MAATDLVTLTETKQALKLVSSGDQDTLLSAWIEAVSTRMDDLCGPVVHRTITGETHDGYCRTIYPRQYPISSVTAISEYTTAGTERVLSAEDHDTKPAEAYLVDGEMVRRRRSGTDAMFESGRRNVRVTYVAGRYATTAAVSQQFKRAALIILAHMWREEHGAASTTYLADTETVIVGAGWAIPRRARDLLGSELRPSYAWV